jgi:hypothetical protein
MPATDVLIICPCVDPPPAAFGDILFGNDTGVTSGVQSRNDWLCTFGKYNSTTDRYVITSFHQSLGVSIFSARTFRALFAAPTTDFLGRQGSVVLAVLVFVAGVAMQAAALAILSLSSVISSPGWVSEWFPC